MNDIVCFNPTCSEDEFMYDDLIRIMEKPDYKRNKFIKLVFYQLMPEDDTIKKWMDKIFLPMHKVSNASNFAVFFYQKKVLAVAEFQGAKHGESKTVALMNTHWFWRDLEKRSFGDHLRKFFDDKLLEIIVEWMASIEAQISMRAMIAEDDAMHYSHEDGLSVIETERIPQCPDCGATDPDHGDENSPCPMCDGKLTRKR